MERRIYPLTLSTITVDKGYMTYLKGYGEKIEVPVNAWYIEDSNTHILVDVGAPAMEIEKYGRRSKDIMAFEDALGKFGLMPNDIDIIISTHLHYDHILNAAKCNKARVFVQERELKFALNPHPVMADAYPTNTIKTLKYSILRGDQKIIDGIDVILTPGHTIGTQSVCIETSKGLAIITGFCCTMDNFTQVSGSGITIPGIHYNVAEAYDSLMKVKLMADILIPLHDPETSKKRIP